VDTIEGLSRPFPSSRSRPRIIRARPSDRDRGVRLPAAAVRPGGHPALPRSPHRPRRADGEPDGGRRAGAPGRHRHDAAGARHIGAQGRACGTSGGASGRRLRARAHRREGRGIGPGAQARCAPQAYGGGDRGSLSGTARFVAASRGVFRDRVAPGRRRGTGRVHDDAERTELVFSNKFACPICNYSLTELEPRLFSFNSPIGACPTCDGLGTQDFFDPGKIVANPHLSLAGAPCAAGIGAMPTTSRSSNPWRGMQSSTSKPPTRASLRKYRISCCSAAMTNRSNSNTSTARAEPSSAGMRSRASSRISSGAIARPNRPPCARSSPSTARQGPARLRKAPASIGPRAMCSSRTGASRRFPRSRSRTRWTFFTP